MYKILGGDGQEYGPVSTETLRQWINEGRANRHTKVRTEDATQWVELASLPEFAPIFTPPPPGMAAAMGGAPTGPAPTSGLAIAALALGITGFFCGITAIPGLILGFVAMSKIKSSQGRLGGHGVALAGTIVSGISMLWIVVLVGFYAALLLPGLAKAKQRAQTINCVNNVKQLCLATVIYAGDYNDTLPAGTNWCDAIQSYSGSPRIFVCPGDTAGLQSGYAFNAALSGLSISDIAPDTVMIFECDSGWNASGGKELLTSQSRHYKTYVIGHADGSVQQVAADRLSQLRWDPTNNTTNSKQ